jgi:hypothetical protein
MIGAMDLPQIGLSLLSAMITPAVLISACGTLIFSTSTRLARVVDRVRQLTVQIERLFTDRDVRYGEERRREVEAQLGFYARRARLVQGSLTSFYLALGLFVATTIAIALTPFAPSLAWLPSVIGIVGTLVLFVGCMLLINETRLALQALTSETAFALRLSGLYQADRDAPDKAEALAHLEHMREQVRSGFPKGGK